MCQRFSKCEVCGLGNKKRGVRGGRRELTHSPIGKVLETLLKAQGFVKLL